MRACTAPAPGSHTPCSDNLLPGMSCPVLQVWHMVFHPAGNAGLATVLAAPRYTFMHQVHTTYEDGVHAVLFSSVPDLDVKPEWVERARARTQSVSGAQGR